MNINFLNSCYNISALSTCVLEGDNKEWPYGAKKQIPITDRLSAVAKYSFLGSDYMSLYDYEVHTFSIDFFRDGKMLDGFSYEKQIKKERFGSLANPAIALDAKLATIRDLKPGLREKLSALATSSILTPEEVNAVIAKSHEILSEVADLQQQQGMGMK